MNIRAIAALALSLLVLASCGTSETQDAIASVVEPIEVATTVPETTTTTVATTTTAAPTTTTEQPPVTFATQRDENLYLFMVRDQAPLSTFSPDYLVVELGDTICVMFDTLGVNMSTLGIIEQATYDSDMDVTTSAAVTLMAAHFLCPQHSAAISALLGD